MKRLFAGLARRRLQSMPAGPPSPELQEANAAFIEAWLEADIFIWALQILVW